MAILHGLLGSRSNWKILARRLAGDLGRTVSPVFTSEEEGRKGVEEGEGRGEGRGERERVREGEGEGEGSEGGGVGWSGGEGSGEEEGEWGGGGGGGVGGISVARHYWL